MITQKKLADLDPKRYLILHADLSDKGIHVGHLSLGIMMKLGTQTDLIYVADTWYYMFEEKEIVEDTYPKGAIPETIIW
ncbi:MULTISPECIES: dehydrogenase [unclassified Peribacillus]|uniref:dehydrogenase n=1 Tax=unclassified Peribacillus TaxID=2675266 RepID=UPI0019136645|nr:MULTISPECIES: dehydrogenase [unclassified Peribacillus]MBK5446774.1 dehydrogenase [Peribacillus sp. TH24]MBK5458178.1 dehydrogenase [Peribacillus sp. TH27]